MATCNTIASARPCLGPDSAFYNCHVSSAPGRGCGSLECFVQEVVLSRGRNFSAPPLGALFGSARLLYVEVALAGRRALRTETGTLFQESPECDGQREEVWIFGAAAAASMHTAAGAKTEGEGSARDVPCAGGSSAALGELLSFDLPHSASLLELEIRVFSSHATWHLAFGLRAPLVLVGEARLPIGRPSDMGFGERWERCVPLSQRGETCGQVALAFSLRGPAGSGSGLGAGYPGAGLSGAEEVPYALDAEHVEWTDVLLLGPGGRFRRASGDSGSWWLDDGMLMLAWDCWEAESLFTDDGGCSFRSRAGLRMHGRAEPPEWFAALLEAGRPMLHLRRDPCEFVEPEVAPLGHRGQLLVSPADCDAGWEFAAKGAMQGRVAIVGPAPKFCVQARC